MHNRLAPLLLWLVALFTLTAKEPDRSLNPAVARRHVLMVNERGQHLDAAQKWKLHRGLGTRDTISYDQNIAAIREGIRNFGLTFVPTVQTSRPRVVIFAHGGLNYYAASQSRLENLLKDGMLTNGFHPVLLVWNSGFVSSYWEHLTSIRQGEVRPLLGPLTAPMIFFTDIAKGAVRLPLSLAGRWYNDFQTIDAPGLWDDRTTAWEDLEAQLHEWEKRQSPFDSQRLFLRPPQAEGMSRSWGERLFRGTSYVVTQPTKIATLPLADGLATEAWGNMVRRTKTMFQPPETYDFPKRYRQDLVESSTNARQTAVDEWMARQRRTNVLALRTVQARKAKRTQPDGTMYQFARELENWTTNRSLGTSLQWHFVGHSMGAMVLNELFRVAPDIRADRVTYLAAACSIRSFQENMVPYLRRQKLLHDNPVHFHNLSLHRIRERDNSMDKVDLIPRGTLLNYIDDVFARPATVTDRTLGSWENLIPALPDFPADLRPRIHFVCFDIRPWAFSSGDAKQPQNHSSFAADFAFWEDDFISGPKTETERQTGMESVSASVRVEPQARSVSLGSTNRMRIPSAAPNVDFSQTTNSIRTVRRLKK